MVNMQEKDETENEHSNPTRVYLIDDLVKILLQMKEKGYPAVAMRFGGLHGSLSCPTKTVDTYRIPLTLSGDLFKSKTCAHIDPVGGNIPTCVLFIKDNNVRFLRDDLEEFVRKGGK